MHTVLLVQVRKPGHDMEHHERACVAARLSGRPVRLRAVNVFAEQPTVAWLDGVHGVIVGGSGSFSVQDPRSHAWVGSLRHVIETCLTRGLPGLGICFGHQLIGLHLGADVITDISRRESGTIEVHLTGAGRADPLFRRLGQRFFVHTGHTDLVVGAPAGTELLASTELVPTQAFRLLDAPWWTTQFHPDLRADEANERYHAYESALALEQGRAADVESEQFHPRGDPSSDLIRWWADRVWGRER